MCKYMLAQFLDCAYNKRKHASVHGGADAYSQSNVSCDIAAFMEDISFGRYILFMSVNKGDALWSAGQEFGR